MFKRTSIPAVLTGLVGFGMLAVPGSALAQDLDAICADLEESEVGEWAEYETTTPQGSGTMRMALLPEGAAPDEGQWFEISGEMNGQNSIIQVLADEWPYMPDDVVAVVVKMGAQPAMRLPEQMLGQMRDQMRTPIGELSNVCAESELVASESVETPAGTFDAHRIQPPAGGADAEAEVWLSTDVPFGIVKSEGAAGSMVLTGMGSDATSTITETPGEMPAPGGMGAP